MKFIFLYLTNKITEKIKVISINNRITTNQFLKITVCCKVLFNGKKPIMRELNSKFRFRRFRQIFKINYIVLAVNFRPIYKKKVVV